MLVVDAAILPRRLALPRDHLKAILVQIHQGVVVPRHEFLDAGRLRVLVVRGAWELLLLQLVLVLHRVAPICYWNFQFDSISFIR